MQLTAEQVATYERDGFLLLEQQFSPAEIEILMGEIPCVFGEDSPRRILEKNGDVRSVFASHETNEVFHAFARLPRLVEPARQLLGSDVYVHQFKINAKLALSGDVWEWHQDYLYWQKEDGMPEPRVLTAVAFLQPVDDFNGPMLLIPGSHKETVDIAAGEGKNGWMPTLTADLKYKINKETLARMLTRSHICAAKGGAGFVLFFHGNVFHASATNLSARDRISVFATYNSVENALHRVEKPRPDFLAARDFRPLQTVSETALLEMAPRLAPWEAQCAVVETADRLAGARE